MMEKLIIRYLQRLKPEGFLEKVQGSEFQSWTHKICKVQVGIAVLSDLLLLAAPCNLTMSWRVGLPTSALVALRNGRLRASKFVHHTVFFKAQSVPL